MDNQISKLASNMAVQIANLNIQLAQAQVENKQLTERNTKLQESVDYLRKEVKKNESSDNNSTNEQIDKRGK